MITAYLKEIDIELNKINPSKGYIYYLYGRIDMLIELNRR